MKILSVEALAELVQRHGFERFMRDLVGGLKRDFGRWDEFQKMPRPAMHVPGGVIELMPVCDNQYYSYKYVGGAFPENPSRGKQSVVATGQLSRVLDGYPVFATEMTVLTALRTGATAALGTDLMARRDAKVMALIGTGAQGEFQVRGVQLVRDVTELRYYDIDPAAMEKLGRNLADSGLKLVPCETAEAAVTGADIVTVVTACKDHVDVVKQAWLKPGAHINGMGGDCPGKTELELSILKTARVVVEYFDQSKEEGEIQRFDEAAARKLVHAELYELVTGAKKGRESDDETTVFDCVGIALEDYTALRLAYELAERYGIGEEIELAPLLADPKDLYAVVAKVTAKR